MTTEQALKELLANNDNRALMALWIGRALQDTDLCRKAGMSFRFSNFSIVEFASIFGFEDLVVVAVIVAIGIASVLNPELFS